MIYTSIVSGQQNNSKMRCGSNSSTNYCYEIDAKSSAKKESFLTNYCYEIDAKSSAKKESFLLQFWSLILFSQVDVGSPAFIGRLRIQRLSAYEETDRHYVSQFYLSYSLNGWEWNTEIHEREIMVRCNVNTRSISALRKL